MPANLRQTNKRELERAVGNIDKCLGHIAPLAEMYRADHPEVTDRLELDATVLMQVQTDLTVIKDSI